MQQRGVFCQNFCASRVSFRPAAPCFEQIASSCTSSVLHLMLHTGSFYLAGQRSFQQGDGSDVKRPVKSCLFSYRTPYAPAPARIDPSPPTVQRCLADCLGGGHC